jgi:DNA-binding SARP family transcriptional activator/tetratricopeptide (TPR) repeat protein
MNERGIVSIKILGGFSIHRGDEALAGFERPSLQRLLVFLLLNRGQPVSRSHLAFCFWTDSTENQALSNLRNLWYKLQRVLPEPQTFLTADRASLKWHEDAPFVLDAAEFEGDIDRANRAIFHAEKVNLLQKAVRTYRGELLPGHYDEWLLAERKRLAQRYSQALAELVSLFEKYRQYQQAIRYARALIRHDSLHEPAYAQLMRLQALMDDRAAALHTYHTCATLLEREMGVEPGPLVQDLYHRLLKKEAMPSSHASVEMAFPLVGRDASWEILQDTWRKARREPQMVLIKGEAGIGKTHLAEAFGDWVGRQGLPVLRARCFPTEDKLSYAPVVSWLRGCPLANLDRIWLQELMRLMPEIQADHPNLDLPEPITKEWQRLHLFHALAKAIMAGQKALLLIIDDLQWCDQETLDWLSYLLTANEDHGRYPHLMVIGALRTDDYDPDLQIAKWQEQLIRADRLVTQTLGPLDEGHTLALANHVYGRPIDPGRSPDLYQATEGHPFFIVELVRSARLLSEDQVAAIVKASASLPDRVRQVLEARLAQLSPLAREVIEQASVIGRDFTFPVLAQVTHLSEDGLVDCLDECWQRRIIREQGESAYDFSHDTLRRVAYDSLSETRRRWLHKQIAETLEKVYVDELDRLASVIAGHYEAAQVFDKAIKAYQRAAEAANRVYAHEEELAALEDGLRLLPELPEGAERQALIAILQEKKGDLNMVMAAKNESRSAYQAALANTPPSSNLERARLVYKIGIIMESERAGFDEVFAQYEGAEAILGEPTDDRDSAWRKVWCDIQLSKQSSLYWWQRPDLFNELINQTRPLIEAYGTPNQKALFFHLIVNYLFLKNKFTVDEEIIKTARASLDALPEPADLDLVALCRFGLGFCLIWYKSHEEAAHELREAFRLFERTGNVTMQVRVMAYRVVAHRFLGDTNQVEEIANRCLALAQSAGMYDYIGVSQAGLAWLVFQQVDPLDPSDPKLDVAAHLAHQALEAWEKHGSPYSLQWQAWWPLIRVALVKDQLAEAIGFARGMFGPDQQAPDPVIQPPLTAALAAWDAENRTEAQDFLQQALAIARSLNFA